MQVSDTRSDECQIDDGADRLEIIRSSLTPTEQADELAQLFRLLGDATRLRILSALVQAGELSVGAIAEVVETTETKVSQALRLLRGAGVVKNRRSGRLIHYRLNDDHVRLMLGLSLEHLSSTVETRRSLVGTVERISTAPDHGEALVIIDEVAAVTGVGLSGDRHAENAGRQVSIQSRTELDRASKELGRTVPSDKTRRNITIDSGELPRTRGQRLFFGQVELEVFSDATPCYLMDEALGDGASEALEQRAGIHCRVITGGTIRMGDDLVLGRAA